MVGDSCMEANTSNMRPSSQATSAGRRRCSTKANIRSQSVVSPTPVGWSTCTCARGTRRVLGGGVCVPAFASDNSSILQTSETMKMMQQRTALT